MLEKKYRLEESLGRGSTGEVFRARDLKLKRDVAVKIVRAELLADPEALLRFRREAQIVAALRHPSIVAILDYGNLPDGGGFLVMELVLGEDLRHALLRDGRIDPVVTAGILTSVCSAIEAAHREGVLHGDLKPENILLPAGDGVAKVVDFAVANLVTGGPSVGTPAYMAPERFQGAPPDERTDVFSLGVIAFEMLSGALPYGRGTPGEVVLAQSRGVPKLRAAGVSAAAERAVRTALDADPDRRPGTPQAFAHLINAAIGV